MCELFAMSASRPVGVGAYLKQLMPRGGRIGPHNDGWGVAYFEGLAARVFKEAVPASESPFLSLLAKQDLLSHAVIAHIRLANPSQFGRAACNTHPFEREYCGRSWVFAHNGKLPALPSDLCEADRFRPIGGTDSERAFCYILNAIVERFGSQCRSYVVSEVVGLIRRTVSELKEMGGRDGELNFILSDGDGLYVYADTRLQRLIREVDVAGHRVKQVLLATAPLTGEAWWPLTPGTIQVYRQGVERHGDDSEHTPWNGTPETRIAAM